ncbi:nucleotidyl transferase AbiEii/AbiGii toxin family protein [Tessaracoccus sp. MC1627]|uniref:nucleotidyl transferase AbiEii/AbiGii toxin family protein n=1 Tax=Tessaracoccus sp. MC1627 TaxID=2760312 RepID=UPI0016024A55|nr:nucleotidyl transferase AbiEii/AbiGii toxin family protein [Tessaracoccus sp. MC1627]MBB1511537.1 nucleotidyl transferase AbiEii/AbiGii toxin family protein [Tessaracoccus sp. MC1627]
MPTGEEHQRQAARIILAAIGPAGFALAGSGAIREHGLIDRPTNDIDLFAPARAAAGFSDAIDTAIATLTAHRYTCEVGRLSSHFARLLLTTREGYVFEVDLGLDWRAHDPIRLEVGPVLAIEDAVANKVGALYSRGEPRDYLDVDAIRESGRFAEDHLLSLAAQHDPGFDVTLFATRLRAVESLVPDDIAEYGISSTDLDAIKRRLLAWGQGLTGHSPEPTVSPDA